MASACAETYVPSQYGVGDGYNGQRTVLGACFITAALTAAHQTHAFGSHVTVANQANGAKRDVRIIDRSWFAQVHLF